MLVRRVDFRSGSHPRPRGRRGAGIPWFLITAPFLALVAIWVVHTASLYHRQAELEVAAEATACGVAAELADDLLLTELTERQEFVEHQACMVGKEVAKRNHVLGQPVQ